MVLDMESIEYTFAYTAVNVEHNSTDPDSPCKRLRQMLGGHTMY